MLKTLLLVEDDYMIAMGKQLELEKYGYKVIHVNTGEKAVLIAKENREIDLILMDIDLGKGIDGTEAAELILKERDIPVVFLSSHMEPEVVEKTEKITSYGYIVKSSSITVLDASIKMAFKLFKASSALKLSEEKFHVAFTTSPDAININDIDGRYININEGFTWLTGFTEEDVIGVLSSDIDIWTIPADREKLIKELKEAGRVENLESVFRCKDGSLKTALMSAHLIILNNEPHILSITRDITEYKLAQQALKNSEETLSFVMAGVPALLAYLDRDLNYLFINNAYAKWHDKEKKDIVGRSIKYLLSEEVYNFALPNYLKVLKGETVSFESKTYDSKKQERYVSVRLLPHFNEGKVIGLFSSVLDISEHKLAEKKEEENTANLDSLINNREESIWSIDRNYNYIILNNFFKEAYQAVYNVELKKGMNALNVLPPEQVELWKAKYDNALSGEAIVFEFSNPSGHSYKISLNPIITNNEVTGVTALSIDITDRIIKEQASLKRESLLIAFTNALPDHSLIIDEDGKYIEILSAEDSLLYNKREELVGSYIDDVLPKDVLTEFHKTIQNTIKTGKPQKLEYPIPLQSGETWLQGRTSPMKEMIDGKNTVVWLAHDITERKMLEQEVKQQLLEKQIILKEVHHRIKNNFSSIGSLISLQANSSDNPEVQSALKDASGRVNSLAVIYE
ncbi:MAG: PAS domain S-box protein [Spirochaetia bacterium]|jgi:PAS domain S-box-containing protein|nr:PAS domain S-box protein [Spirochaetia bacterium]